MGTGGARAADFKTEFGALTLNPTTEPEEECIGN